MAGLSHVYRALRVDEIDSDGDLICKDSSSEASASDAVERGVPSKWVICSKNRFVALFYAEEHPRLPGR